MATSGTKNYCELFPKNEQIGRLVMVPGKHARGETFHIYVMPKNETAVMPYEGHKPLNDNIVEVFGIIGRQPGWKDKYGWKREGPWQKDFQRYVDLREMAMDNKKRAEQRALEKSAIAKEKREQELLSDYE